MRLAFDPELIVPDPTKSLRQGAIDPWNRGIVAYYRQILDNLAAAFDIDLDAPWSELPAEQRAGDGRVCQRPRVGQVPGHVRGQDVLAPMGTGFHPATVAREVDGHHCVRVGSLRQLFQGL